MFSLDVKVKKMWKYASKQDARIILENSLTLSMRTLPSISIFYRSFSHPENSPFFSSDAIREH